jgi:hypothetical protein
MKVQQLIEALQEQDPEAEVQVVHQPSWPLRERVTGVWVQGEGPDEEGFGEMIDACRARGDEEGAREWEARAEEEAEGHDSDYAGVAFIVANGHPFDGTPYGPKAAFGGEAW